MKSLFTVNKISTSFSTLWTVLLFAIILAINTAKAETYQNHDSIRQMIKEHLQDVHKNEPNKQILVSKLNPRLQLKACKNHPEIFFLEGSKMAGNTTIGVRCTIPKAWVVYVPAKIKIFKKILVSSNSLPRNKIIEAEDFKYAEKEVAALNSGYFVNPENLIGKVTRRSLPPGYLFSPNSVQAPKLVLRGEDVAIVLSSSGFDIRVSGIALMDGSKQQKIKVRNKASKKVLNAIVTARGVVSVRM